MYRNLSYKSVHNYLEPDPMWVYSYRSEVELLPLIVPTSITVTNRVISTPQTLSWEKTEKNHIKEENEENAENGENGEEEYLDVVLIPKFCALFDSLFVK